MSTLQIRKLQSGAFEHIDSIDGAFFLGRFNFKQEFNKAFLVEAYGAKRRQYSITEVEVFDFGGTAETAETFTNWTDLINRLVDLGYTGIDTNSIPSGGGVWGSIIGSISSQTDLQNELNTKLDKVTTVDVEKVYIKNADGTQGMKPVSELLSEVLSNDIVDYTPATLPLTGTEEMILNNGSGWKRITWTNIKAQLKTYFDTVYQATLVSGTNIKTINGTSVLGSGDLALASKRTVCFTYEFNGALNTATNNWWGAINNSVPSQLTSNASLTPANNFSSAPVQAPAWVVPFNCRLKSITFKGFSNTMSGVVDLAFTSGTFLNTGAPSLSNSTILSNQPFTLHNYLGIPNGACSLYVFDTGFTNYIIPKGYEIRMFMNNRNVAKNLLSTTIIIEFEEEL